MRGLTRARAHQLACEPDPSPSPVLRIFRYDDGYSALLDLVLRTEMFDAIKCESLSASDPAA